METSSSYAIDAITWEIRRPQYPNFHKAHSAMIVSCSPSVQSCIKSSSMRIFRFYMASSAMELQLWYTYLGCCRPHMPKQTQTKCVHNLCVGSCVQWRSQGLTGWANRSPGSSNWGRKWKMKENNRIWGNVPLLPNRGWESGYAPAHVC